MHSSQLKRKHNNVNFQIPHGFSYMANQCLYIVGILFVVLWITPSNGNKNVDTGIKVSGQDGHHVVAQKNGKLLLNCSVETNSKYGTPLITWRKDGAVLNLDNRIQKVQNGSLYFRRVQHKKKKNISDEGMYECLVQNNIGSIIARRVKLEVASIAKSYTSEPQDQEIEEGGVARFECKIKAVPPPLYTWIKDEVQLTANDRYIIINSGILQILNVNNDDEGHYSCTATSGGLRHLPDIVDSIRWKRSSEAYLTVKSGNKPRSASIVAGPSNTIAQSGQAVVLECLVDGNPRPSVKWRREDGRNITRAVRQIGTNLKFLELEAKDAGNYVCEVSSQNGPKIMARARLDVTTRPVISQKPETVEWPVSRLARFSCAIDGSPKPKVTWYKNGQKISKSGGKYQIRDDGQLVVTQTVTGDSGYYQCIAENKVDFVTSYARLSITTKDEAPRPPVVTAVAKSSTSIEVQWSQAQVTDGNCQVLAYSVDLKETNNPVNVVTAVLVDSEKTFTNLKPYTNYTVFVRAYASVCGASEQSEPKTVTTLEAAPTKAPLIRLASTTPNTILVSWDPLDLEYRNGVVTEYQIYYMKEGDKIIMNDKAAGMATSFLIKNLLPDTVYRVRVLAATKAGYGRMDKKDWPWVDYRTPSTGNLPDPPKVQIIHINMTAVNVSWNYRDDGDPVVSFQLTLKKQMSSDDVDKFDLPADQTSLVLTNLENNTFYVVSLTAKNAHGESSMVEDQFQTSDNPHPATPKNLVANSTMATKVHLTWKQPARSVGISYYTVRYYAWNNGKVNGDSTSKTLRSSSVTVDGLKPFTFYLFEVQAHTMDGKVSPFCKPVILRTKEDVPSPPVNMSALTKNRNIIVTWKPPVLPNGNITKYVILFRLKSDEDPSGDWHTVRINGTITSWNLPYQEGNYYYLKMLACTGAGASNSTHTILVPQQGSVTDLNKTPQSGEDQNIGIIIGVLIGVVCIIICVLIIICRNRCFGNNYPQTQAPHFHGNGHVPNHGNGHATRLGEQTVLDHHQMEQFTPILSENQHCDSKGCGSGNLIVTPNGTRINGYVPFKNGMRNGHVPNGRVTAFSGKGEIAHPEETRGLIAYMIASSDGSHTSEEGNHKCPDKTSLEDIDRSLEEEEEEEPPQLNDISQSSESCAKTPPQGNVCVHTGETNRNSLEHAQSYLPCSSLRSSAENQQSTSSSPSCRDPPSTEMDVNPHFGIMPCSEDTNTSCQPQAMNGSKKPQLCTSVTEEKPQTNNTSDLSIPSCRNGQPNCTSNHRSSQPGRQIQSRAQEEVITRQGYTYQPPPPPYPGKKRCFANTSPQEHGVNPQTVDA